VTAEEEFHVALHHGLGLEDLGSRLALVRGGPALDADQGHELLHRWPLSIPGAGVAHLFHRGANLRAARHRSEYRAGQGDGRRARVKAHEKGETGRSCSTPSTYRSTFSL